MSTVHQFPVQRNQPPAAPEEVADALGVAIDAAVGADASFEAREAAALALTNECHATLPGARIVGDRGRSRHPRGS